MKNLFSATLGAAISALTIISLTACGDTHAPDRGAAPAAEGLSLSMATHERVVGTYHGSGSGISFEARLESGCHVFDVMNTDGSPLLRGSSCAGGDVLQLADGTTLDLPPGILTSSDPDAWVAVMTHAPEARAALARLSAGSSYKALSELPGALAVEPAFMSEAPPSSKGAPSDAAGSLQPLNHSPEGCAACHGACAAADAACLIAVGWSPAVVFCAIVAGGCHVPCAATLCQ
jgi:hypothetical protein